MTDLHHIPKLDRKGLQNFGLVTGGIIAALFGLFFPWLLNFATPIWPFVVGGILVIWALSAPMSLRPVYYWWMRLAILLNKVTTPIILGIVFFLMFFPIALLMKLSGRDPMARLIDKTVMSYRVPSRNTPRENMEKPF